MAIAVATFYKFVALPNYRELQPRFYAQCQQQGIKGTILLAAEGINGTLAGTAAAVEAILSHLQADPRLQDLEVKRSTASEMPFARLKVKLKREIVAFGVPEANPTQQVGTYVEPQDWNDLISDPEVVVIDTRNDYEVAIGTFQRATNPQTQSFRQFPEYVQQELDPKTHRKVAMFCTGGIRCEKASAYLLAQGFEEVYHLKGGILKYLEEVPADASLWQGECFVFDERVAVQHGVQPGHYESCRGCGRPIADADKVSPEYEPGVCCPACAAATTEAQKAGRRERMRQLQQQRLKF
jgi:UPF0176 protein